MEQSKEEPVSTEGMAFRSERDILSTQVTMCQTHTWRKLNEKEIACTVCPTVNIVDNANMYV